MVLKVGLVGCGNISDVYLTNAALFADFDIVAVADIDPAAAQRQSARYGVPVLTVPELMGRDDIGLILNLTVPAAHVGVALQAIAAGKHVYGEKPLATTLADGMALTAAARTAGVRLGSAPDTFLGGAQQMARALIDKGAIGRPLAGVMAVMSHGMEMWHPNPGFFFRPGAGPVFDMGPYYLTALIALLGPVASVSATGQQGFAERTVTAESSPHRGETIRVEVLTHVQALLSFASGAQVTFLASWDVWRHGVRPIELYGTEATLRLPDPNEFGGSIALAGPKQDWTEESAGDRVFGRLNWPAKEPWAANYRGLGLADMAQAIATGRPHRANGDLALHTLAIMAAMLDSAGTGGAPVSVAAPCERPAPLSEAQAATLLAPA